MHAFREAFCFAFGLVPTNFALYYSFKRTIVIVPVLNLCELIIFKYIKPLHDSDVTSASRHLKSLATRHIIQQLVKANNKENTKASRYCSFVRGIHCLSMASTHYGWVIRRAFRFYNVIVIALKTKQIITKMYSCHRKYIKHELFFTGIWQWIPQADQFNTNRTGTSISQHFLITVRPRRNEQHFADDIFKRIFFNENVWISIKISLKFVPKGPINNIPALVRIMAWRRSGDKPLSESMMVSLPTHICVTRHQWVIIYDVHHDERTMDDNSVHGALSTEMSKRC